MIKTILFDVDNTLLDFDECSKLAIKQALSEFDLPFDDFLFETYLEVNKVLWQKIETGELTRERLYQIRWQIIFDKLGIHRCGQDFELLFLDNLKKQSAKIDGADEILQYLSAKYNLCVASNAPYAQQMQRLKNADLNKYFNLFFVSEKVGHQKPTKEFFDFCFDQLGNPDKNSVMIIGDSVTADISGGKAYGIKTCWFDRYGTLKKVDADYTIKNLLELKKIL